MSFPLGYLKYHSLQGNGLLRAEFLTTKTGNAGIGVHARDIAAGVLLVREAGGVVTDPDGGARILEIGELVATNDALHPQILKLLKDAAKVDER